MASQWGEEKTSNLLGRRLTSFTRLGRKTNDWGKTIGKDLLYHVGCAIRSESHLVLT